jgi:hypothetical protein
MSLLKAPGSPPSASSNWSQSWNDRLSVGRECLGGTVMAVARSTRKSSALVCSQRDEGMGNLPHGGSRFCARGIQSSIFDTGRLAQGRCPGVGNQHSASDSPILGRGHPGDKCTQAFPESPRGTSTGDGLLPFGAGYTPSRKTSHTGRKAGRITPRGQRRTRPPNNSLINERMGVGQAALGHFVYFTEYLLSDVDRVPGTGAGSL